MPRLSGPTLFSRKTAKQVNFTNRYEETGGQVDDQGGEEETVRHANQGLQDENVKSIDPASGKERGD